MTRTAEISDRTSGPSRVSTTVKQAASIVSWLIGVGYYVLIPVVISAAVAILCLRLVRR